ncbi:hypothetical protein J4460_03955 [Candidatus Woesearchaeota archaeon]|nr:hypothetical protein [Candidatus Woesearchaeota archaeon]HIH38263.1 hypothetical protein [Candidatus Woesearchaeota archaeon]HIH49163.1 hypothetical protein [Candidatus Woesearchaeota archaeon]HIJ04419.1 hypothetical protein [Candidatus Woesearchaeota archaeon]
MARVEIVLSLYEEIEKVFKKESVKIFALMESVQENPKKGKVLGQVGSIVIKELRYDSFRFYFLADGYNLKFLSEADMTDLLLRFVRMSDKKHQQKAIDETLHILTTIGPSGFS